MADLRVNLLTHFSRFFSRPFCLHQKAQKRFQKALKLHLKLPKTVLKVGKPFVKRTSNFVVYKISNLADLTSLEEKFSNFVKRFL